MKKVCFWVGVFMVLSLTSVWVSAGDPAQAPTIVVAEGENFTMPKAPDGWHLVRQDDSYASHIYGGMWSTFGAMIGAPAASVGSIAKQTVQIPAAGAYRVWSKYQSPPYFNYRHRIEVYQNGKKVFSREYGGVHSLKLWSFAGAYRYKTLHRQIFWDWGIDHDCAEPSEHFIPLKAGKAEIRLITVKNPAPAGDRYIDFIVLTTRKEKTCDGFQKYGQAKSPFTFEAMKAKPIYMRFKNTSAKPGRIKLHTLMGHLTWTCGWSEGTFPQTPVAPGAWSKWFKINFKILRLCTDEGVKILLPGASQVPVEIALDGAGRNLLAQLTVPNKNVIYFPKECVWDKNSKIELAADVMARIEAEAKNWRKSAAHKPQYIAYFGQLHEGYHGAIYGRPGAVNQFKDLLGYNTQLPDQDEQLKVGGYFQHTPTPAQLKKYVASLGAKKSRQLVISFGDEISMRGVNLKKPENLAKFRQWLKRKKLSARDLGGVAPAQALPGSNARTAWYARIFSAYQGFAFYRNLTALAKQQFGSQVETGANFSPHHGVAYYGENLQWIDAFKAQVMTMFWTEDYIFSMQEVPQIFSFLFARIHCATKYHHPLIHMYVMPHAPSQTPEMFYRNSLFAIGSGARHIDHFWVAPAETFSENYVSWSQPGMFKAIYESIYDTAKVEPFLIDAKRRPARVAIITGKATNINEPRLTVETSRDAVIKQVTNRKKISQNICEKDQQQIYLALRRAQYKVDLITEDDIAEDGILKAYDVVYFAGEWIDYRIVPRLRDWVKGGGVLVASSGLGMKNQFGETDHALLKLAGLKSAGLEKNLYHVRPMMELPVAPPIGRISFAGGQIDAMGMKQVLVPATAEVIGKWHDGSAAVTSRTVGNGRVFAIGALPGLSWLHSGQQVRPWPRGGRNMYSPDSFSPAAVALVDIGVNNKKIERELQCSPSAVEGLILDNRKGSLLTLVNWDKKPVQAVVSLKLSARPKKLVSVVDSKTLNFTYEKGRVVFTLPLATADYVRVFKK